MQPINHEADEIHAQSCGCFGNRKHDSTGNTASEPIAAKRQQTVAFGHLAFDTAILAWSDGRLRKMGGNTASVQAILAGSLLHGSTARRNDSPCSTFEGRESEASMNEFVWKLLSTDGFPPRWHCGDWSSFHGWLYIASDLGVWSAYTAIPAVLIYFVWRNKTIPFKGIFLLFGAFILACGLTHLLDAVMFWWPAYRLLGLVEFLTAIVSWATVVALVPLVPQALAMRALTSCNGKSTDGSRPSPICRTSIANSNAGSRTAPPNSSSPTPRSASSASCFAQRWPASATP